MHLSTINIPFLFNSTAASLTQADLGIMNQLFNPLQSNPPPRWFSQLNVLFNKTLDVQLIVPEVAERKTAYEAKHGVVLDEYPKELLQFEQAYYRTVKTAGQFNLQYDQLRALSDVLTDEAFLTSLECDLDTPYADVILAIQTTTPADYYPIIEYTGSPQLQYKLGERQDKLHFLQILIGADVEETGRTILDLTDEVTLVDPAGARVGELITASIQFQQQQRLETSVERWIGYINQHSTPVEVATLPELTVSKWAPEDAVVGSIFQSFKLPDGTLFAAYPTNHERQDADQPVERATLILAFSSPHSIYVCTDRMDEEFVTEFFPAFLGTAVRNEEIGGYLISAMEIDPAERQFERFMKRKPAPVKLMNGGW